MRDEIKKIQELMEAADYVTDAPIATSVYLAMTLKKPLLIEGHAGVGKTEVAKVLARMLGTNLIRLQCYEGLDQSTALYEWNYQKQLLRIKMEEGTGHTAVEQEATIFSEPFLLKRPLLQAITQDGQPPVLLIDEIDRCVTARTLLPTRTGMRRAEEVEVGDEVVSFDPDEFRITRARVRKVIAREASTILRLLVGGRFLEVTPEHRFVRYSDSGHELVRASDLRIGDRLPLYKGFRPVEADEPEFDFPDNIVKLTGAGRRLLHSAYKASGKTYEQISEVVGVSRNHLRNVIQPRCRDSLRAAVLENLSRELDLNGSLTEARYSRSLRVRQSVAFYELLGYIVADGCFSSDRLCVVDKDKANLEIYSEKFREAFGESARIRKGPHRNYELTYHSLPLGRFLSRVLGPGLARSRARMVPNFVFSLPSEKRAAFTRGYFDGEAWVAHHQVSAGSSSPYLLAGIQQLLSSVGVDSHISRVRHQPRKFGKGPYFVLTVSDVRAFVQAVGFCSPAKKRLVENPPTHAFTRTETPRAEAFKGLGTLRDRHTLHGKPSHRTVDDILAGRVHANVSSLGRICEAFDSPELRDLLERGAVLGEVTSIEAIPTSETVYDFVLEGSPYFVANQVVTHNCDEEFEAFLLEVLSDFQVTIPEVGTIKATQPPYVVLTSNRARELSDALRRRCLYLWIDYPSFEKEVRIVTRKVPGVNERLARQLSRFMESLRQLRLSKVPGVAETLDWAQALTALHADHLDEILVAETLGCVLKDAEDIKRFRQEMAGSGLSRFLPLQG
jgi:MoxR-like ATPase/intein/homing endonuclease